jgi:hypothetical protein
VGRGRAEFRSWVWRAFPLTAGGMNNERAYSAIWTVQLVRVLIRMAGLAAWYLLIADVILGAMITGVLARLTIARRR